VIRFDAAMTLAKKHYQRLWFPEPGTGGAIPSRAGLGLTKDQFDAAMPVEFWQDLLRHDVWLSPEEAIALGIADAIIEPQKRGNLRKMRISQLNQPVDKKERR
jgi:hypothetical protein